MPLIFNGTTISKVIKDGSELSQLYYDGVQVFSKMLTLNFNIKTTWYYTDASEPSIPTITFTFNGENYTITNSTYTKGEITSTSKWHSRPNTYSIKLPIIGIPQMKINVASWNITGYEIDGLDSVWYYLNNTYQGSTFFPGNANYAINFSVEDDTIINIDWFVQHARNNVLSGDTEVKLYSDKPLNIIVT